ncbi:hypothetical protein SAMN04487914_12352 [Arthrobacter sp. ok909]|uniref:hypothetical protein n=1 Tax=Arthrobacter sp. ok909 TaxID=1761746 RepID=UPI000887EABD|nr:hypothetical protein [Arthrobacter sp. ok909]SDP65152.1 hypothetical protein SAMN04487914_12352 [Arthrobacter sp. ok909]
MGTAFEPESRQYFIYQSVGFLKATALYEPVVFLDRDGVLKKGKNTAIFLTRYWGRNEWSVQCDGDMTIDVVWFRPDTGVRFQQETQTGKHQGPGIDVTFPINTVPRKSPTISINIPANNSNFPDGDKVPIDFDATAFNWDGSPIPGSSFTWSRRSPDSIQVPGTPKPPLYVIGAGNPITATFPQQDYYIQRNEPTPYIVSVMTDGSSTGVKASFSINISVGKIVIG